MVWIIFGSSHRGDTMKISSRGRYGLRAMVDLAAHENDRCITLKSIALRQGISENYLEQLIAALKKAGFVSSVRGAQGGYHLTSDPSTTTVGDILRALEGSLYPVECISEKENTSCGSASCQNCVTKPIWEKLYETQNDILDSIFLQDLVNDYHAMHKSESAND